MLYNNFFFLNEVCCNRWRIFQEMEGDLLKFKLLEEKLNPSLEHPTEEDHQKEAARQFAFP